MPIEIRELVIKAEVRSNAARERLPDHRATERLKQEIIAETVDKVMAIIQNKKER